MHNMAPDLMYLINNPNSCSQQSVLLPHFRMLIGGNILNRNQLMMFHRNLLLHWISLKFGLGLASISTENVDKNFFFPLQNQKICH